MINASIHLEGLSEELKTRIEPFVHDLQHAGIAGLRAVYLTGPAVRGEFSEANPELQLLVVADVFETPVLDAIAALGNQYGKKGIRAPLMLTPEYLGNARDVFPMELFDLKHNHHHLLGDDPLADIDIDIRHLRLQCERELRLVGLQLRQAYLRSAGDGAWFTGWLYDVVSDVFPALRAALHLLGGDTRAGNTEILSLLNSVTGIDMQPVTTVWESHKNGKPPKGNLAGELYEQWRSAFAALVERVDAL